MVCDSTQTRNGTQQKEEEARVPWWNGSFPVVLSGTSSRRRQEHFTKLGRWVGAPAHTLGSFPHWDAHDNHSHNHKEPPVETVYLSGSYKLFVLRSP